VSQLFVPVLKLATSDIFGTPIGRLGGEAYESAHRTFFDTRKRIKLCCDL